MIQLMQLLGYFLKLQEYTPCVFVTSHHFFWYGDKIAACICLPRMLEQNAKHHHLNYHLWFSLSFFWFAPSWLNRSLDLLVADAGPEDQSPHMCSPSLQSLRYPWMHLIHHNFESFHFPTGNLVKLGTNSHSQRNRCRFKPASSHRVTQGSPLNL